MADASWLASSGNRRSIVAMIAAVGFFSLMDAVLKVLTTHYPPMQVAALRGLSAWPFVLVYVLWFGSIRSLWRVRWPLHLMRGATAILMLFLFAYGIRTLPLTEAYTLFFIAPLLITLLSIPVLKERVRLSHVLAIAGGMVGVVIAMRPQHEAFFSLGALAILGAATCYAASAVVGRLLSRTDSSASLVWWTTLMLGAGAGALAWPAWVAVDLAHGWLILALAVTGFLGQLSITEAFRHGQASIVAPFEYTALAWGVGLDWVLWQVFPDIYTWVGGAIVVASGLYLLQLEARRRGDRPSVKPDPQAP